MVFVPLECYKIPAQRCSADRKPTRGGFFCGGIVIGVFLRLGAALGMNIYFRF